MDLFIGSLQPFITKDQLKQLFSCYGRVLSAKIIRNRETGESRGFGFVSMATEQEGRLAIRRVNGQELEGRILQVKQARPRESFTKQSMSQRQKDDLSFKDYS